MGGIQCTAAREEQRGGSRLKIKRVGWEVDRPGSERFPTGWRGLLQPLRHGRARSDTFVAPLRKTHTSTHTCAFRLWPPQPIDARRSRVMYYAPPHKCATGSCPPPFRSGRAGSRAQRVSTGGVGGGNSVSQSVGRTGLVVERASQRDPAYRPAELSKHPPEPEPVHCIEHSPHVMASRSQCSAGQPSRVTQSQLVLIPEPHIAVHNSTEKPT